MADNVVSMKKQKKEGTNPEETIGTFMERNRKPILITGIVVLAAAVAVSVAFAVVEKTRANDISKIDSIEYTLTKDSASLSDEEIATRGNTAIESLKPYLGKHSVVGVRANMIAADVSFQKKDYENSRTYWLAAANAQKSAYTAPICNYNAAVCSEELNDNESAAKYYDVASQGKDFLLVTHTLFSLGRVKEAQADFKGASETYQKMVDKYPSDEWTKLAQSRLIALKAAGKITEDAPAAEDTDASTK